MIWRVLMVMVVAGMMGVMTSCGNGGDSSGKMKVGLLVVGSTSDGGWNQLAKDALDKAAKSEGVEVRTQQQVGKDKAGDAIRQFDAQGYALVIAHGFEYQDVVKELTDPAKGSVKAKVVVSGGNADSPNFQALEYDLSGASYQLGMIAARVSKSGKLGFIGGAKFDTVTAMQRGFVAGAKSVNPNVTVVDAWPGWDDPSKAKREAESFIAQGVDVIMQNVDAASRGVFEAVKEHNANPAREKPGYVVYTFGANSDQNANPVCGEYTLASAVIKMDLAFRRVIKDVKAGTFKGGNLKEGIGSGVSVAVINPKLAGTVIDEETQKMVEEAGRKLGRGQLEVPRE